MNAPAGPRRDQVSGLVLAGGQGRRMGGLDKGLQPFEGRPLAAHALARLAPQVGALMLSANRHLDAYAALGVPVWPDALPGYAGPLAGLASGLAHCTTPWLACVPCDAPRFPTDLVDRLMHAAMAAATPVDVAVARSPQGLQPTFCLLHRRCEAPLAHCLSGGGRKLRDWLAAQPHVTVDFDDAAAFANLNTLEDLHALQAPPAAGRPGAAPAPPSPCAPPP